MGPSAAELGRRLASSGRVVAAPDSGYLQFVSHDRLVRLARRTGSVIRLHQRPGHFVVRGQPLASVWPADAAERVERGLRRAHVAGPGRTLSQDVAFAVDQLVEIAIRALSPAVNDTFTALTCIDWLGESLSRVPESWQAERVHRDGAGYVRVLTVHVSHERLLERAFTLIRQAGHGMPAVMIRQLDALTLIAETVADDAHRAALLRQAEMIERAADASVDEPGDRAAVTRAYAALVAATRPLGVVSRDQLGDALR